MAPREPDSTARPSSPTAPNLSDYRLFADASNPMENANDGIIYDLTTPLFTDYANKYRFVFVPEGTEAAYRSQEVFDFPVGTVIAKTFTIQADLRDDSSAEEIIETRILIHRKEGWTSAALYLERGQERCGTVGSGRHPGRELDRHQRRAAVHRTTLFPTPITAPTVTTSRTCSPLAPRPAR